MSRTLLLALAALMTVSATAVPAVADESDRKARRAAIVAGAVREDVATQRAVNRYNECLRDSGYDTACERQLYQDERKANRAARRTAIIVGSGNN